MFCLYALCLSNHACDLSYGHIIHKQTHLHTYFLDTRIHLTYTSHSQVSYKITSKGEIFKKMAEFLIDKNLGYISIDLLVPSGCVNIRNTLMRCKCVSIPLRKQIPSYSLSLI